MKNFISHLGLTAILVVAFHLVLVDLIGCPLPLAAFIVACCAIARD